MPVLLLIPLSVLLISLGLLYVPLCTDLVRLWWTNPNYSHGFLVPLITGYLVWSCKERLTQTHVQPSVWGAFVLAGALFSLLVGQSIEITGGERGALFLKGISLILACAGITLFLAGTTFLTQFTFPLIYLIFMIPLPDGLFTLVTLPLQSYATAVTTSALQLFNIPALREGNLIHLPSLTLGVTEACSGIRSLFTLLAGATVLSYLTVQYWWQHLILIGSVIPIAIATNAFRVTGTGLLAYFFGERVAQGFFHGFSGWVILIMAATLLCAEILLLVRLSSNTEQEVAS